MQACEHGDAGDQTHTGVDTACQLELFDEVLTESEHTRAELPVGKDRLHRRNTRLEVVPIRACRARARRRWIAGRRRSRHARCARDSARRRPRGG